MNINEVVKVASFNIKTKCFNDFVNIKLPQDEFFELYNDDLYSDLVILIIYNLMTDILLTKLQKTHK